MLERFKIISLCILAAIVYGIIHDQITVRICLEYFTVFHPPILNDTHNPTLLGFGWGIIATWWVGFFLGLPLSICATVGDMPRIGVRQFVKPLVVTLTLLGFLAAVSGLTGYLLVRQGVYILPESDAEFLPPEHIHAFVADMFTHLASYLFGALLGILLCVWTLRTRYRRRVKAQREMLSSHSNP